MVENSITVLFVPFDNVFFSFWKLFIETTHTTDLFHGCFSFDFHQCCIFFSYIDDIGQTYTCNTTRITSNEKRFAILANHDLLIWNATTTKKKWRNKFSQENPFSNTHKAWWMRKLNFKSEILNIKTAKERKFYTNRKYKLNFGMWRWHYICDCYNSSFLGSVGAWVV